MEPSFLARFAEEIHAKYSADISNLMFVFPSKRSGLFFKKELALKYQKNIWAPQVTTIESFIEDLSGWKIISSLDQIFHLYEIHVQFKKGDALPLEKFIDFAKILLADFNELDMAMANSGQLFSHIQDYTSSEYWVNYDEDQLGMKFMNTWKEIPIYYTLLNEKFKKLKMGYQGCVYKNLLQEIENDDTEILNRVQKFKHIHVAGLNALTKAETLVLEYLQKKNRLSIYFEAENQMVNDNEQESGLFLRDFYKKQGGDFKWVSDNLKNSSKQITTYEVNGDLAIARMVHTLIAQNFLGKVGSETAIVLSDENLLIPVLESLPKHVENVNVTLGVPLSQTPFMSVVEQCFGLHQLARNVNGNWEYYFKDLIKVITNPVLRKLIPQQDIIDEYIAQILKKNTIWLSAMEINKVVGQLETPFLAHLFKYPWKVKPMRSIDFIEGFIGHYEESTTADNVVDDVLLEQLYFFKSAITKLKNYISDYEGAIGISALKKLFGQVIANMKVPFSGEPLAGVQILGILETRLLRFKNVIFLSVNEGVLPAKGGGQSYIPNEIKEVFGIQTHQHRDSIYAYHFYRIVSQAQNVSLVFNSATEGVSNNEKSRFIRQIEQEWPAINKQICFDNKVGIFDSDQNDFGKVINKTPEVIANITDYLTNSQRGISPSALSLFKESPYDFYYSYVCKLSTQDEVDESMQHNTFGSIVHECIEEFFKPFKNQVLVAQNLQKRMESLGEIIHACYLKEIPVFTTGKHLLSFYSLNKVVENYLTEEIKRIGIGTNPITLLANEKKLSSFLEVNGLVVRVKGTADRIQKSEGKLFIVDYKTGSVKKADLEVDSLVSLQGGGYKPKFAQLAIYAWLAQKEYAEQEIVSGIYGLKKPKEGLQPASIAKSTVFGEEELLQVEQFMKDTISEMLDPHIPLVQNADYQFKVI